MSGSGVNKTSSSNSLTPSAVQPDKFVSPRSEKDDGIPNGAVFAETGNQPSKEWNKYQQAAGWLGLAVAGGLGVVLMAKADDAGTALGGGARVLDDVGEIDGILSAIARGFDEASEALREGSRLDLREHPLRGSQNLRTFYHVLGLRPRFYDVGEGGLESIASTLRELRGELAQSSFTHTQGCVERAITAIAEGDVHRARDLVEEATRALDRAGGLGREWVVRTRDFLSRISHQISGHIRQEDQISIALRSELDQRIGADARARLTVAYYLILPAVHVLSPTDARGAYQFAVDRADLFRHLDTMTDGEIDMVLSSLSELRAYYRAMRGEPSPDDVAEFHRISRLDIVLSDITEYRLSRQETH